MKYLIVLVALASSCLSCDLSDSAGFGASEAASGSITKFKVAGEYLYVIDANDLRLFSLEEPMHPQDRGSVEIGIGPETLFRLGDILFVGAQTGMYIFSMTDPAKPTLLSHYEHVLSCDPVVANEDRAYVTLRSGVQCRGAGIATANELHTIDITDKTNPRMLGTYWMEYPKGLGLDDNLLFVCDSDRGVLIFELDEMGIPTEPVAQIPGFEAIDVIARDNILLVVTKDQILQFDYSDINNIKPLSSIAHGV